jgi:hypothetical protein
MYQEGHVSENAKFQMELTPQLMTACKSWIGYQSIPVTRVPIQKSIRRGMSSASTDVWMVLPVVFCNVHLHVGYNSLVYIALWLIKGPIARHCLDIMYRHAQGGFAWLPEEAGIHCPAQNMKMLIHCG